MIFHAVPLCSPMFHWSILTEASGFDPWCPDSAKVGLLAPGFRCGKGVVPLSASTMTWYDLVLLSLLSLLLLWLFL